MSINSINSSWSINTSTPINTAPRTEDIGVQNFAVTNPFSYGDSFEFSKVNQQVTQQKSTTSETIKNVYEISYNINALNQALQTPEVQTLLKKYSLNETVTTDSLAKFDKSHIDKTVEDALLLANKLGISEKDKETLVLGAVLHDIGKTVIPDEILNKPGQLTDEEKEVMACHTEVGAQIVKAMGYSDEVSDVVKNHHSTEKCSLPTEIVKIADKYDALVSARSYKQPFSKELTFQVLNYAANQGEIDSGLLKTFKETIETNQLIQARASVA